MPRAVLCRRAESYLCRLFRSVVRLSVAVRGFAPPLYPDKAISVGERHACIGSFFGDARIQSVCGGQTRRVGTSDGGPVERGRSEERRVGKEWSAGEWRERCGGTWR